MASLAWEQRPELRRPVLVAGFEGWNDAASAASEAAGWLTRQFGATKVASMDPEEHFDFQSARPTVELVDGVTRDLTWPANEFFAVPVDARDIVVLRGVEPNLRWPSFCRDVLGVASETGCEMVVTLGALLADVPHTRPVRVTGATTDPELMGSLHLQRSRYEGPTGIVGVLHDTARATGVASASLWAPVPHYVSTPPNPLATRALLDRLAQLLGTSFELGDLDELSQAWQTRVDEVVSQDDDVRSYVGQLEERYDTEAETDIPSGEGLADEVEQFLRDRGDD
ncbi:MAG TPA: PAC2 family protein [Acidimicrobiia bacterium]|jgi:proteasome assembly chaperone (PAC2) family protein|nr:PAC2 family protein [Acidimicrobiia bacterium]